MLRLHESDDDAEQMELTRREHPDAIGAEPSNRRNGALTATEYDLVELDCTMSGRVAIANVAGRLPVSIDCLRQQETCQLPVLPVTLPTAQAPAQTPVWEEATPEEMAERASEGTLLLVLICVALTAGILIYSWIGGQYGAA